TGGVAVLRPPLSEVPVADALDTSFDDDLGRSEPARHHGSALLQGPPARGPAPRGRREMVGATGFEPATSCSRSRRATKLRYAPSLSGGPIDSPAPSAVPRVLAHQLHEHAS